MRPTPALKVLGRLVELLLLLVVVAAGAAALRLAAGPIPLDAFAGLIERTVERAGPFDIAFEEPALAWSQEQQTLQLRVSDLEVRTEQGALIASAPAVGIRVDVPALLRRGEVRVREAEIMLPTLQLVRHVDDRHLVLNFGGRLGALPLGEATGGGVLGRLAGGAEGAGDPRLASLRRIRVSAEGLQFDDEGSGRVVESGQARLRLTREDGGTTADDAAPADPATVAAAGWELRLDVDAIGGAEGSHLRLTTRPAAVGSPEQRVAVELERVPLSAMDGLLPEVRLANLSLPVSADIRLTVDPRTRTPGPGTFRVSAPEGTLGDPALFAAPVRVRGVALAGEAGPGWREVRLTRGEVGIGEVAVVRATGLFRLREAAEGGGRRLELDLDAEGLDARTVEAVWPLTLATATRRWFAEHVDAGTVPEARVELALPAAAAGAAPPPTPDYVLRFAFKGGEAARFLPDWPAAQGLAGTGRLDRERFVLDLAEGRIGGVTAGKAVLTFTDLRTPNRPTRMAIDLDAAGTVQAALDLLAREPIGLARLLGIAPDATDGRIEATIAVALPLRQGLKPTDVSKKVAAKLGDLQVRQIRPGFDVTGGDLTMRLDDARADIAGAIALNTVPATIKWRERLVGRGERRRIDVAATLDPERSRALGAPWPAGLAGEIPVTAVVAEADRQPRRIAVQGDLAGLRVDRPELGLVKRAGEAGRLEAKIDQPEEKRLIIADADASWGAETSLSGGGEVRLAPFEWRRIDLAAVRTPTAELRGTLARDGSLIRADVDAARLDLRPYRAKPRLPQAADGDGPDVDLSLRAARLSLGPAPLEAVTLAAGRRGGRVDAAELQARLPGGGAASFSLKTRALPGEFAGETSDLGALLLALDLRPSRISGGRGRVAGRVEAREGRGRAWNGEAKLRDLVVRDAPFLARLLTLASLQGLGNALSGQGGLEVARVTVPFVWTDDGKVQLRQVRLVGSGLGARVDGTVDTAARTLALEGTLAPLYALNRLLGQIPIIGNLMRGEKADAAFAATFSVGGAFDDPQVTVNPLAAVVPGFLRDLVGDLLENAAPADQRVPEARD